MNKRLELLALMDAAGLINVPKNAGGRSRNQAKKLGLDSKEKIVSAVTAKSKYGSSELIKKPGIGPGTVAELCWIAVYGNEKE